MLYVGTERRRLADSKSNLRKRLSNHHRSAIGSSTFRLDLVAFLWQREGWQPCWTNRPTLLDTDFTSLARWQCVHLCVQWVECARPWNVEKAVVRAMRPPLNRRYKEHHPAFGTVRDARGALRAAARSNPR